MTATENTVDDSLQVSVVENEEVIPGEQQFEESETETETSPEEGSEGVPQETEIEGDPGTPQVEKTEDKPKPNSYQQRINELTRQKYELKEKNARLTGQLEGRVKPEGEQAAQPVATPDVLAEPDRDSFETYEDYVKAVGLWSAKVALADDKKASAQQKETDRKRETVNTWNSKVEEARTRYSDFDVKVNSDLRIPQAAFEAIVDSPVGPDIAYHIGTNPDIAEKFLGMSGNAVVREIGKLEMKFESDPATTPQPKPKPKVKPATVAGTPVTPVNTNRTQATKDPEKMTHREYMAWRDAGGGK